MDRNPATVGEGLARWRGGPTGNSPALWHAPGRLARYCSREGDRIRTLVHLSDVHFGRTDDAVVGQLINSVHQIKPDVVAISGDLTQRARPSEFERARTFLRALPTPQIV